MSLWNKIVNLFMEEEEEIIETTDVEPVLSTPKKEEKKPAVEKVRTETSNKAEEKPAKKEEKKSIFINNDSYVSSPQKEAVVEKPSEKEKPVQNANNQPRVITNKETGQTYEFRPVISPMFGVTSETPAPRPVVPKQTSPVHNSSVLGTIVSPIYGISPSEEQTPIIIADNAVEEDIENFSLEDLLGEEPIEEELEDDDEDLELEINIPFVEREIVDVSAAEKIIENARTTDAFLEQEKKNSLREDLTFATEEPTVENIVFGTLIQKKEIDSQAAEEVKEEAIREVTEESGANAEEIRQAMKEFSEEDYFEKENQPTLFDL